MTGPRHTVCVQCGKTRRPPAKGHKTAIDAWMIDPFCSTECAREFHRNPLPERSIWSNDSRGEAA